MIKIIWVHFSSGMVLIKNKNKKKNVKGFVLSFAEEAVSLWE